MKKLRITFVFIITLLILSTETFAYNVNIKTFDKIKPGDKLEIIVSLEAIEETNIYSGVFEYNKEDFEEITEDNFDLQEDWEKISYNKENGIFIVERKNKVKGNTNIFKINLIAKQDVNKENVEISLKENLISGGINDTKTEDKKLTIEIVKDEKNSDLGYKIRDNYIVGILAKTPIEDFKSILVKENEYEVKIKKDDKEVKSGYISTGMKIYITDKSKNENIYEASVKGDVNCDGIANSLDTQMIKGYRNDAVKLDNVQIISADLNDDGRIDRKDSKLLLYHRASVKGYDLNYKK